MRRYGFTEEYLPPVLSKERNRQDFLEVKQITGTMEFTPGNGEVTFRKQWEQDIARSRGSVEYRVCDLACLCVQYVSLAPRVVDAHVET